jgi:Na+-translocating ferredoxin:NAD+ oxidoreductase RnfG subunit
VILADAINWNAVILALIAALPGIIAAVYAGRIHRKIKTPSGTPIGQQVEGVLHTALANNYHLQKIAKQNGGTTPPEA